MLYMFNDILLIVPYAPAEDLQYFLMLHTPLSQEIMLYTIF